MVEATRHMIACTHCSIGPASVYNVAFHDSVAAGGSLGSDHSKGSSVKLETRRCPVSLWHLDTRSLGLSVHVPFTLASSDHLFYLVTRVVPMEAYDNEGIIPP